MSRLTNKNMDFTFGRMNGKTIFNKIYRKLSQLEDIEKELDIELTILFELYNKMSKQKFIYVKIGNEIRCEYNDYFVVDFKNKEFAAVYYELVDFYGFKDYGKTWALTKEELNNETSI